MVGEGLAMTSGVEKNRIDLSKTIGNFLDSGIIALIRAASARGIFIRGASIRDSTSRPA